MYVAMYVITMSNVYGCVCLSDTMLAALILMGLLWLAFDLPPPLPSVNTDWCDVYSLRILICTPNW